MAPSMPSTMAIRPLAMICLASSGLRARPKRSACRALKPSTKSSCRSMRARIERRVSNTVNAGFA